VSKEPVSAVLLHGYSWGGEEEGMLLGPGVELCALEGSPVAVLYDGLCRVQKADDGEPFLYEVYARLDGQHEITASDPCSSVNRFSNVVTVVTGQPVSMVRLITSTDGFETVDVTEKALLSCGQAERLERRWPAITSEVARSLATAWATEESAWERAKSRGRLFRALENFHYAWRAPSLDQTCVNLGTCLAVLLTPDQPEESPRPIIEKAVALAEESANNAGDAAATLERLFELRTKVIFGIDAADEPEFVDTVVDGFHIVAGLLRSVLLNPPLARKLDGGANNRVARVRRSRTAPRTDRRAAPPVC